MNFSFRLVPLGQQSRISVKFWGSRDEGMKLALNGVEFGNPISIALRMDLARNLENKQALKMDLAKNLENEQALYTKTPKLGNITNIQLKRCVS
jgi:hypothetical protein